MGRQVSLCLYADSIAAFILYLLSSPLLVLIVVGRLNLRLIGSLTRQKRGRKWEVVCAVSVYRHDLTSLPTFYIGEAVEVIARGFGLWERMQ